jgi:hypothetical protein
MADTKISALPASTTPLAGTEVLPIVQGGVTKQVSVANLTAGRAVSATELTLTTGNLIVSNGKGIDFSATPGTGTSELLSDYEEGTWTPSLGGSTTYTLQTGRYTKVGRLVTATGILTINVLGTGVTSSILGLPFVAGGVSGEPYGGSISYFANVDTNVTAIFARVNPTTSQIDLGASTAAQATISTVNIFNNGTILSFVVQYEV